MLSFAEEEDEEEKGKWIYRLYEDSKVVCTAVLFGRGNLLSICSNPKGKGFGKKMLEYFEKKALESNLHEVTVSAIADDERVKRFFEKNGYKLSPDSQCLGESEGEKTLTT